MMKKIIIALLILSFPIKTWAQKKIINQLFSDDTTRHNSFLPLPVLGYSQEAGLILGATGIFSFYTDKDDPHAKASEVYGLAAFSTKKQLQIAFKADVWTKQNKFHYLAELKYFDQPFNFYGIGNATHLADEDVLNLKRFRINAELEKKVIPKLFLGGGFEYENQVFADKVPGGIYQNNTNINDKNGGQYLFLKGTAYFDSRNSITYPSKGFYAKLQYNYAPNFFGKPNFIGSLYKADLRNFYNLSEMLNLALNATFEGLTSKEPIPFYNLRQMGNDQFMRGYYTGRFRDENLITSQAEFRFRPNPRYGLVAFVGTGKVYANGAFDDTKFKPDYGLGARFFFDLEKGLAIRMDYAWGQKPAGEKRIGGFYLSIGEAF